MGDIPWPGDACALVDAFRSSERSPLEELEATLKAIESSALNAFSYIDADRAMDSARNAHISLPFGGVPLGVKELQPVSGWPYTEASLVFKDRVASHDSTMVARVRESGAVLVGATTASEFGGLNVSVTPLNGVTGNGWNPSRTAGGSSGGSAAAVSGGLVSIATGGDGGGSIRIPAGFNGLVGLKATAGRIPRGPFTEIFPLTVVNGCLARSVRDTARYFDVCNGYDPRDPYSLPRVEGWEQRLGTHELAGKTAVISPALGSAMVRPEVAGLVVEAGEFLVKAAGLKLVEVPVNVPELGLDWVLSNLVQLRRELGDKYPDCEADLTAEIAFGLRLAMEEFNLEMAAAVERHRTEANEAMADLFDQVDFVVGATNPDVAYPAEVTVNYEVGGEHVGVENNAALTIPSNMYGNPAISVPVGEVDSLPVGMQILSRHHTEQWLLDLALVMEKERPWPLVSPLSRHE